MKLKSKHGIQKNDKIAGAGNKHADWIPKNKCKPFKVLFNKVRSIVGTYEGAKEFIGLSNGVLDGLEKEHISAATGKKILDAYNKIKHAPCKPENQCI